MAQHPYLHYLYAKERQRDFLRDLERRRMLRIARDGRPSIQQRVTVWLADRLIASGEKLRRRYTATAFTANQIFTPVIDTGSSTLDHTGCGPDCVVCNGAR
jgi:hypothetical protein